MPTPTNPTNWQGDPDMIAHLRAHGVLEEADKVFDYLDQITHLATLLDGVLADDPQAIRDAAAWLAANRPTVDGGDSVDVRWLDTDGEGEG